MPTLRELEATFLKIVDNDEMEMVGPILTPQVQGIEFLCPKCFKQNGGRIGTHAIICWFRDRGVPDNKTPAPGRWTPRGTSVDDLTFVPGNPPRAVSVLLSSGCGWHGFITNGHAGTGVNGVGD